jgi:hypothetical protein
MGGVARARWVQRDAGSSSRIWKTAPAAKVTPTATTARMPSGP